MALTYPTLPYPNYNVTIMPPTLPYPTLGIYWSDDPVGVIRTLLMLMIRWHGALVVVGNIGK